MSYPFQLLHHFYKEERKKIKRNWKRKAAKERRELEGTLANLCELDDPGKTVLLFQSAFQAVNIKPVLLSDPILSQVVFIHFLKINLHLHPKMIFMKENVIKEAEILTWP